jgi:hypothetical protein
LCLLRYASHFVDLNQVDVTSFAKKRDKQRADVTPLKKCRTTFKSLFAINRFAELLKKPL